MFVTLQPIGRLMLRNIANRFRELMDVDGIYIDVLRLIESCQEKFSDLDFIILDDNELATDEYARFIPGNKNENSVILLKNTVYEGALGNDYSSGRERMTIVHEIAHYLLVAVLKVPVIEQYHRGSIPLARSSEWQAMALAGEIMMPFDQTEKFNDPLELAAKCGVSFDAAYYRIYKYRKER